VYTFYDGADPIVEATDSGGDLLLTSVNTFGAMGLVSSQNAQTAPNEQYYDFDARGNVSQRLSQSGSILSTDVYNAYGKLLSGNPSGDEFGFGGQAGYRTDQETGLVLLGERYYDPSAERFLTRDPLGYGGGMDLYAYCGDNPVNRMDPMGLNWDDGDPTTPDTVGGWIDHFVFNDSVNNLGTTVGEADAGCATLTDELFAGGKVAGYGALLFVPGGEEARAGEIGGELGAEGLVRVYRGTNNVLENEGFKQTGHLLSEAGRKVLGAGGTLEDAYAAAAEAHSAGIAEWGSEAEYAQAHNMFGQELSELGDRSFLSVTTNPDTAAFFAQGGTVYSALVRASDLVPGGEGEAEGLLNLGSGAFSPVK
jgi:RHS repeat-associated protein